MNFSAHSDSSHADAEHTETASIFARIFEHLLRVSGASHGELPSPDPVLLALIAQDCTAAMATLSRGVVTIGNLLEHRRRDSGTPSLATADVIAIAHVVSALADLRDALRRLTLLCEGALQAQKKLSQAHQP